MPKHIKQWGAALVIILSGLLIAACNGGSPAPTPVTATPSGPQVFDWDHSPSTVVFQMNRSVSEELHSYALNRLPLCTLFGNGHLIWTTSAPATGQQVLETTLSPSDARDFLVFLINDAHFFSIPDYAARQVTPSGLFSLDTMTINLTQGAYTARSFGLWPNNEYQSLLNKCTHLATAPTLYMPTGGWMGVEPIEGSTGDPAINWGQGQPFQLVSLIHGQPIWVSGDTAQGIWRVLRRGNGAVKWTEGTQAYRVFLQVPGLSPGAPPAPSITPTPFPTLSISVPGSAPTRIPASTTVGATSPATLAATSAATPAVTATQ